LRWGLVAVALATGLIGAAVYTNAVGNPFLIDDQAVILRDQRVQEFQVWALLTGNYWYMPRADVLYRPLVMLSFAANWAISQEPSSFRIVNIAIHAGVCALLVVLARRLFGSLWCAGAAGLVFAVHPIHTEALNVIVGRTDLAVTLFVLLAAVLYSKGGAKAAAVRTRRLGAVTVCFAGALLCKENGVVLPGVMVVLDWWRWRRDGSRPPPGWWNRRMMHSYLALVLVFGLYLLARWASLGGLTRDAAHISVVDNVIAHPDYGLEQGDSILLARWATPLVTFAKSVALLCFPARLSNDYSYAAIDTVKRLTDPRLPMAMASVAAVITVGIWSSRRRGRVAVGLAITLVTYSAVSNTAVIIGTIFAERLLYLPSVGAAMMAGVLASSWIGTLRQAGAGVRRSASGIVAICFALLLAWFGWRTIDRNRDWRSKDPGARAPAPISSQSVRVLSNLAGAAANAGDTDAALEYCRRAIEIYPDYESPWRISGLVYHRREQFDEALRRLRRALELGGANDSNGVLAACGILVSRGHYRRAIRLLTQLVRNHPLSTTALNDLAWCLITAQPPELRDPVLAVQYAREAVRQDPSEVAILDTYVRALVAAGQHAEAQTVLERRLDSVPVDHDLRRGLVELLQELQTSGR
jgi:Flp pilus assembly protein TadD